MKRNKTNEEFAKELQEKRPDLEQLSFYVNAKTKVKVRCKECGYEWSSLPNNLFQQKRCPVCSRKHASEIQRELLKTIIEQVKEKWGNLIIYFSGYIRKKEKCKWLCNVCGNVWETTPECIINKGTGCPVCSRKRCNEKLITPLLEMLKELKKIHGDNIVYVSGYESKTKKCTFLCKICGTLFERKPFDVLQALIACPSCVIANMRMPVDVMKQRLKEIWGNLIEYVEGYVSLGKKCKFKCTECGLIWEAVPSNILSKHGCPICVKYSLEKPVMKALKEKGIIPLHDISLEGSNYNGSSHPLRVDFIIETSEGKLAIETDGKQHFHPIYDKETLNLQQKRDRYKDKILKERGYVLIRVTSSHTKEWGFKNHITLAELLHLIEIGINKNTGKINFELFKQYDFNRE